MTARKSTDKAAESEKDQSAVKDESKTVQTTKQAEEAKDSQITSAEKREVDKDRDVKADEVGTKTGLVVDGENDAFEDDAEYAAEDFEDGGTVSANGAVFERNVDGEEYEVPYVTLTEADLRPRTSDSDDPGKSWTAQEASGERADEDGNTLDPVALVPVEGTPGETFRVRELPDRKVVEAAGINYDLWVAGLPVRSDVPHEAPRRGIPA